MENHLRIKRSKLALVYWLAKRTIAKVETARLKCDLRWIRMKYSVSFLHDFYTAVEIKEYYPKWEQMGYCSKLAIQTPSLAFADSQGSGKVLWLKKKRF